MNTASCTDIPALAPDRRRATGPKAGLFSILFGIFLPVVTLLVEIFTRMCADITFDPIPSVGHILLVALVPVANMAAVAALRRHDTTRLRALVWLNGLAVGVGICYSLAFAPLTPFAIMGLIAFGIGLLPLTPLISLIVTLTLRRKLRTLAPPELIPQLPGLRLTIPAALTLLALLSLPTLVTFSAAKLAQQEDTSTTGMRLLRTFGSEGCLLRFCEPHDTEFSPLRLATGLLSKINIKCDIPELEPDDARKLYYRLTGTLYSNTSPPGLLNLRGNARHAINPNEFDWGQGRDEVAAPVTGLSLQQSAIECSVDANSATSYTEWTLAFRNDTPLQREARAQIALPPGGVVSRLTLWINGKECEAAFGERGKVKAAYQSVVEQRRDPVLITTSGRDQVLLQCYPVPPTGGVMKVRFGITAPLALESPSQGLLRLPFFTGHNFSISDDSRQAILVKANARMASLAREAGLLCTPSTADQHTLQGIIPGTVLSTPFSIRFNRSAETTTCWTEDLSDNKNRVISQMLIEKTSPAPDRVIIVIDGSLRMATFRDAIGRTIATLPDSTRFSIILAGDEPVELCPMKKRNASERRTVSEQIADTSFAGGADNAPALGLALDLLEKHEHSAIAWIHTSQPIDVSLNRNLAHRLRQRSGGPVIYDLQLDCGANLLRRELEAESAVEVIPDFGDSNQALASLSRSLTGTARKWHPERKLEPGDKTEGPGKHTWTHLSRLWANDEILRLIETGTMTDRITAISLATTHQLVTPVSAAVVLETQEQYKKAGLKPVDPSSVPSTQVVPEPATWALLLIGATAMLARRKNALFSKSEPSNVTN